MKPKQIACIGALILSLAGAAIRASAAEEGKLTVITSNHLNFDYREHFATFVGDVRIEDPQFVLTADRMIVYFEGTNQVREAKAVGNVHVVSGDREADCDEAYYNKQDERIVLTGNAALRQSGNELRGPQITIWLNEERVESRQGLLSIISKDDEDAETQR